MSRCRFSLRVFGCTLLAAYLLGIAGCGPEEPRSEPYETQRPSYSGSSAELSQTIVVGTLDEQIPNNKNAIWCASFQLAWNKLKDDIIKAPVELDAGAEFADRLNRSEVTEQDLPEEGSYAAAGWVKDGVLDTIRREMLDRFQRTPRIEVATPQTAFTAYAFLTAHLRFAIPYFESRAPLMFTDSAGNKVAVSSFGIRAEDTDAYFALRDQTEVLFANGESGTPQHEFAIDPCKTSSPNQLVIARVHPRDSLSDTIRYVQEQTDAFPQEDYYRSIGPTDELLIPSMNWEIEHHFDKLEGACFLNRGFEDYFIQAALQDIKFRLDRSGVELESEAAIPAASDPRLFILDRPFMVLMKHRDGQRPFFVMWVDNAELVSKPKQP